MGPIWGRQDPGGPHVGPMNFAFWVNQYNLCQIQTYNYIAPAWSQEYNSLASTQTVSVIIGHLLIRHVKQISHNSWFLLDIAFNCLSEANISSWIKGIVTEYPSRFHHMQLTYQLNNGSKDITNFSRCKQILVLRAYVYGFLWKYSDVKISMQYSKQNWNSPLQHICYSISIGIVS